jgi:hypothetical protein
MKLIEITDKNKHLYLDQLLELEHGIVYPYGEQSFRINHGTDYFSFFNQLGELHYYALLDNNVVAAVAAGIIRTVPMSKNGPLKRAWYLCDLKVNPKYRGQHLVTQMLKKSFLLNYLKCSRGYAISMNSGRHNSPNRVVNILSHFKIAPIQKSGELLIYSLNFEEMTKAQNILRSALNFYGYKSNSGVKDLEFTHNQENMKILHAQKDPNQNNSFKEPQPDYTHFFCLLSTSPMVVELSNLGVNANATATIMSHRMPNCDWNFILTNEI